MILKNQTKSLHYLDRDSDIPALVEEILRLKRAEITVFLQRMQGNLQEKDAGEYYTIEDVLKVKDGELEKMMRFFRGAVVPYYARQSRNVWRRAIEPEVIHEATIEIKKAVGFLKYDYTGHITDEVNSLATFERIKEFSEFLKNVEAVCFEDQGYIFPDSKRFRDLEKQKGRHAAQRQVDEELYQAVKNRFPGGEIA